MKPEFTLDTEIFDQGPVVLVTFKHSNSVLEVVFASPNIEPLSGYSLEEILARPHSYVQLLHPDDVDTYLEETQQAQQKPLNNFQRKPTTMD